jgi:hypothetical protein
MKLKVSYMFELDDSSPSLHCPFGNCQGVPHLAIAAYGRGVPINSQEQSGQGAVLEYTCENGHHWQLTFTDHSGGTWLGIIALPDIDPQKIFEPELPSNPG